MCARSQMNIRHTHVYTCEYIYTHTITTYTHMIHPYIPSEHALHTNMDSITTYIHTNIHTCKQTNIRTYTFIHTYIHTYTHILSITPYIHKHAHAHAHPDTNTLVFAGMFTYKHVHTFHEVASTQGDQAAPIPSTSVAERSYDPRNVQNRNTSNTLVS